MNQLVELTGEKAFAHYNERHFLFSERSLSFERGMASKDMNKATDEKIFSLLDLLATAFSPTGQESSSGQQLQSSSIAALHVLEYLVRRFDIHARENTAHALLVTILPYHDQYLTSDKSKFSNSLFHRIVRLINVAEIFNQSWIFLRPYASKSSPPPTRSLFAKNCAKNDALVRICCMLTKNMARLEQINLNAPADTNDMDKDTYHNRSQNTSSCRKGIAHVISFTAALLVETITLQCKQHSSILEPTLRTLLPFILEACGPTNSSSSLYLCPNFRAWGYILVTTIAQNSALNNETKEVLANTVIRGSLKIENASEQHNISINSLENVMDSITVLFRIVDQKPPLKEFLEKENKKMKDKFDVNIDNDGFRLILKSGSPLPLSTFQHLVRHKLFVPALGNLRKQRGIDVFSILRTMSAMAVSWLDPSCKRMENFTMSKNQGLIVIEALVSSDLIFF